MAGLVPAISAAPETKPSTAIRFHPMDEAAGANAAMLASSLP